MKSSLHPSDQSLAAPLIASVVAHGGVFAMFAIFTVVLTFCGDPKPVIDLNNTIEVAMVSLPKSKSSMPDRASRAPEPVGSPEPTPVPVPAPEVKHTSDLTVQVEQAKPNPGVDAKRLDDAMKQFERQQAQAAMDAALGTINQSATDPDGEGEAGLAGTVGTPSDPEYARYIAKVQRTFQEQFHPLAAIKDANPGIKCVIHVTVDPATGAVQSSRITRPSGIPAWDAAAQRAVDAVSSIPLPPEAYRDRMGLGYAIEF